MRKKSKDRIEGTDETKKKESFLRKNFFQRKEDTL